ncbi:MAG: carbohydrate binding family 9 domain-containing protein, partial [Gemmatimonadetes bacterium]|nr:carbohydrate binding family 9 domain-containing protein [Gemmatimonadota bacterium]
MRQGIGSALVLILLLFFTPSLEAQNAATPAPAAESASANLKAGRPAPRRMMAVRAAAPPVIDARIDEAVWAQAQVASDFTTLEPKPGEAASEQTEVRVLYDDDAIYVAARLFDRTPDSIVARLARRDNDVYSEWFYVGLDSYNDRRTAFIFAVNPRGVKLDSFMSEDGQREDGGWDPVWDVAADVDALGWTAEMRIPLSQLRFSASADQGAEERVWGITFARRIARTQEFAFWSPLLPDAPGVVSQFGYLEGLRGLRAPRRLEALPYSVARVTRAPGEAGNPFYDRTEPYASVGADVKYGLTSDLTLSATVNPDFGQVEADPSVVNLSAYETFFSERRPFFVEGSDIFRFGIEPGDGGSQQLFYSRRIGRAPQRSVELDDGHVDAPEGTTILGAAKVSGKTRGGWSIGVLEALTGAEYARTSDARGRRGSALVEPLTNYAMLRAKKDFRAGESTVGAIVTGTHRKLDDDALDFLRSAAYAGGVDFRHRFGRGNYEVRGYMLG